MKTMIIIGMIAVALTEGQLMIIVITGEENWWKAVIQTIDGGVKALNEGKSVNCQPSNEW